MKYLKIFPLVILQNSYFQLKKICVRGWCEFLDDVCVPLKNTFLNKIKSYWLKYIYLLLGDATHLYINQNQKYCDYLYIRNHIQQIICPDYCQFLPKFIARFLLSKLNTKHFLDTVLPTFIDDFNDIFGKICKF